MDPTKSIQDEMYWTAKQIQDATPAELLDLVDRKRIQMETNISDLRITNVEFDPYEDLYMHFGKWSHDLNFEIRKKLDEADLFPTNPDQRVLAKGLTFVLLYWGKVARYIEVFNTPFPLVRINEIMKLKGEMETVKFEIDNYDFVKYKKQLEEVAKWEKSSQVEKKEDQD